MGYQPPEWHSNHVKLGSSGNGQHTKRPGQEKATSVFTNSPQACLSMLKFICAGFLRHLGSNGLNCFATTLILMRSCRLESCSRLYPLPSRSLRTSTSLSSVGLALLFWLMGACCPVRNKSSHSTAHPLPSACALFHDELGQYNTTL